MVTNKIISNEVFERIAKKTQPMIRRQAFDFINTESNRDNYTCELLMRRIGKYTKIKLSHYCGILNYAALEVIWQFDRDKEDKFASQVFDTLSYILEGIQEEYNRSMKSGVTILPIIREAVKPIAEKYRHKTNILSLDEGNLFTGERDWERTIYGFNYPEYSEESKQQQFFHGNDKEPKTKRSIFKTDRRSRH